MKKQKPVEKTKYYSWKAGELADGCKQCVRGEKLVLFVTGLCSQRCDFCPISDKKLYKDVIYANERQVRKDSDIIEEAVASVAKGAGITGGDPLMKTERVAKYIKMLKKKFGKKFHTHLYTPLNLVDEKRLKILNAAGLDEIRFHPELSKKNQWDRINLARKYDWKIGVEIPVLPGKGLETKGLIDFIADKVDFLNLNELELADNEVWRRVKEIKTKDRLSYAIRGSEELAKKLIAHAAKKGIRTHYCTCKLKDRVQLAKRVYLRAENTRKPTDQMTDEGMLLRGAIYFPILMPGFGYHDKLWKLEGRAKEKILKQLSHIREQILRDNKINPKQLFLDQDKLRLLTSEQLIKKIKENGLFKRAIVLEYPTFDAMELEVEVLD